MKILLAVCLFVSCVFLFVKLGEKIMEKSKIFQSIINFNNELLCDISLFRNGVINSLDVVDENLKKTLKGAKNSLTECEKFVCSDERLNQSERDLVTEYINAIGKSDEENQKQILAYYGKKFEELFLKYKTDYEKRSKLYLKLGVLCGSLIIVLAV